MPVAVGADALTRPATLTVAAAPIGGSEPALLRAYAAELSRRKLGLRLKVVTYDGVRESADALKPGKADRAVVRPDVQCPATGWIAALVMVTTPASPRR